MSILEAAREAETASERTSEGAPGFAPRVRVSRLWLLLPVGLLALFLVGYLPREARRELLLDTRRDPRGELPLVMVVSPKRGEQERSLKLPATIAASEHTVIHARASGYVRRFLVDLGERVRAEQVLLEIDTPELDRELQAARAELAQRAAGVSLARASREFAEQTLKRYQLLTERKLTSKQELAQHEAESRVSAAKVQVAEAEHGAQTATVQRLEQLKAFAQVRAPFAGTITARNVDRGALVATGASSPLFELSALDTLRVDLHVPQSQIAGLAVGLEAELTVAELPGQRFRAAVTHLAGSLDLKTRTMHVELSLPNRQGALVPGMYGTVQLTLRGGQPPWILPATSLLSAKDGTKVALVEPSGKVRFARVEVERDLGAEVEIGTGLSEGDRVVVSPVPGLSEGSEVRVGS